MSKFFQVPAPNFTWFISKWSQMYGLLNIPGVITSHFPNPAINTFPKWRPVNTLSAFFETDAVIDIRAWILLVKAY